MSYLQSNADGTQRWQSALMNNYGSPQLTLVSGSGARVWDADGKSYLDFVGGIAVNVLGHAHPSVTAAVTEQIGELGHTSNLYVNSPMVRLAEELLAAARVDGKVLFVNSGSEANEAALKISRLTGRTKIVTCEGAFHGRTMGSLSLTGQAAKKTPFEPLVPDVSHVRFGDEAALRSAVDDETAAVVLEPILGEAGVVPAPEGYLRAAREITEETGALLVLDEVQTGIARTGSWFAFQQAGIVPDLITLAKGLGGGLPLGSVIGVGAAADLLGPGQHGSTFAGNPVCCAAGLAVLRTIARDKINEHAAALGKEIARGIEEINHPLISHVRGSGLLLGVVLRERAAAAVASAAAHAGFLINSVTPDVLRLAPPLVVTDDQAAEFLGALPAVLDSAIKEAS